MKDKRRADKEVVNLGNLLDNREKHLDLVERDQTYNVNVAVKKARLVEREHFSDVMKTHKDKSVKIQSSHTVSIFLISVSAQQTKLLSQMYGISYYMPHSLRVIVIEQ